MPAWGLREPPWPDTVVAEMVTYFGISAASLIRQTVGEIHGVHVPQGTSGE